MKNFLSSHIIRNLMDLSLSKKKKKDQRMKRKILGCLFCGEAESKIKMIAYKKNKIKKKLKQVEPLISNLIQLPFKKTKTHIL